MSHQKFVKYLKQTFPSRDLEDVMATIKQKVSAWQEKCLLYASTEIANMRLNIPNLSLFHSSSAESFCSLACLSADSEGTSMVRNKVGVFWISATNREREVGENGFIFNHKNPNLAPIKQGSENSASEDNRVFATDDGSSSAKKISKYTKDAQGNHN